MLETTDLKVNNSYGQLVGDEIADDLQDHASLHIHSLSAQESHPCCLFVVSVGRCSSGVSDVDHAADFILCQWCQLFFFVLLLLLILLDMHMKEAKFFLV